MTTTKQAALEAKFEKAIQDKLAINHSDPNIKHLVAELIDIFKQEIK